MKLCLSCNSTFDGVSWKCPKCGSSPSKREGFEVFAPELADQGDGFSADYFKGLAKYEAGNFWFESRNRLIAWSLKTYFPSAKSFMEVGCGTGFVISYIHSTFPQLSFTGSEIFVAGLRFAKQRTKNVSLLQMDARHVPFSEEFDVVGAFDVLEHIEEDEAVLAQLFRATKPGGGIIITVPQHKWLWSQVDDLSYHKRRYSRKQLVDRVKAAGFEVRKVTSFVSFLLPLMLLSRLRKRKANIDLQEEFKIGARANAILSTFMNLEANAIYAGGAFPAGGSLLLIAAKPGA